MRRTALRLVLLRLLGAGLRVRESWRPVRVGAGFKAAPADPLRVLLIRPDHLGDLVQAAPAIQLLRDSLPQAKLIGYVGPWSAELLALGLPVDRLLTCQFPGFTRQAKLSLWQPYQLLLSEAARLRRERFHLAVTMRPDHWWGAAAAALAGAPARLGWAVPECAPFLTVAVQAGQARHAAEANLDLARAALSHLGVEPVGDPEAVVWSPADDPDASGRVEVLLAAAGLEPRTPIIGVHPGSGSPLKQWQQENWVELVGGLRWRLGVPVVLTGSAAELPTLKAIGAGFGREVVIFPAGPLAELAALFRRCAVVVGADSGPLHLAEAVGAATVRIYGPTDPARFGPRRDPDRHHVLTVPLPCRPCGVLDAPPCGAVREPACMVGVRPAQVLAAVNAVVQPSSAPRPGAPVS